MDLRGTSEAPIRRLIGRRLPAFDPTAEIRGDELLVPTAGGIASASIRPLILACAKARPDDRSAIVDLWFADLARVLEHAIGDSPISPDDLRVRLVSSDSRRPQGANVVCEPFGPFFRLDLLTDTPPFRQWITESRAAALGLDAAEALTRGLRNTIQRELAMIRPRVRLLGGGVSISVISANNNPFVSVGLTSIPALVRQQTLPYGALVAAPRLSAVLVHRVETIHALSVAVVLSRLTADMHRDASDPCSPEVLWYRRGNLYPITFRDHGRRASTHPDLESLVHALPRKHH